MSTQQALALPLPGGVVPPTLLAIAYEVIE